MQDISRSGPGLDNLSLMAQKSLINDIICASLLYVCPVLHQYFFTKPELQCVEYQVNLID